MRTRLLGLPAMLLMLALWPSGAGAAPVVVLGPGGHVSHRNDPFLTGPAVTPVPGATSAIAAAKPKKRNPGRAVKRALARLMKTGAITAPEDRSYTAGLNTALAAARRLRGTRQTEMKAVIANLNTIAVSHQLTPSRLPALFETLDRNVQWWTTGPLLSSDERVEFTGSQLVWQYYPGQGIELQVLGSFAKADGLYSAGPSQYANLGSLLDELIPLAARRGRGMTWEYYFSFDGGKPPWTSAMSQGTAIEALTRAYRAFGDTSYLSLAHSALAIFTVAPPVGVREATPAGARYLQYSFAPKTYILNAFLQSLIGLYDYSKASGDPLAARLFAAGDAEAEAEIPSYDTGAWSLYQPGLEDDLSYHELVTGFLDQLCSRTDALAYCDTAQRFKTYLRTPPVLQLLTTKVRAKKPAAIRFRLSKVSHVGIVIIRGDRTVFLTSASFSYGVHSFRIPALKRRGRYSVRLAATDLAGNFDRITGTFRVEK